MKVDRKAHERSTRRRLTSGVAAVSMLIGLLVTIPASPAQAAPTSDLSLNVISARTEPRAFGGAGVTKGDAIDAFKFILNVDDTGNTDQRSPAPGSGCLATDPGYPDNCMWPSIDEPSGWSPIYAQGNQDDLADLDPLDEGRYLISVMADGYKIDGAHFCVDTGPADVPGCVSPLDDAAPLTVELQPNPLPDGTLRALVFEDNAPTNMGPDATEATMAGFVGHIVDTLGEIQTDVYGNPLCTRYEGEDFDIDPNTVDTYQIPLSALDADMLPIPIPGTGGECVSDANGMLAIPHLGSNRYAVSVTPPDGETWIQTSTLEGNHDYDAWIMEGDTGFDTTFTRNGEPVPLPIFGFVRPLKNGLPLVAEPDGTPSVPGHIKGTVVYVKTYTPPIGGSFDFWGGNTGTKIGGPIKRPWLSLVDLNGGDTAVWVGQGDVHGAFDITGVPDGDYMLSWWDEPQDYNLNSINVSVANGELVHMGNLPLNGWWTEYDGYVFDDANRNGKMDWNDTNHNGCPDQGEGELGVPNFTLTLRHRENNLYDRGQSTAGTDACGHYYFESGYPIGEWTILEAYSDSYYTTGVTYQTDNQPTPTTIKGAGVDVSVLPIIGLSGRVDWGVHAYDPTGTNGVDPQNGGIVGTVSYDTTRNELDPQYAATEDWSPGISGVPVELYAPIACGTTVPTQPCDADGRYELASDGSYAQGQLLNTYLSESWERPRGCTARDVDGNPLQHGVDENVLVPTQDDPNDPGECISSFMQGIQVAPYPTDQGSPDANFGAAVNGNYGFGDGCFAPNHLDPNAPVDAPVCRNGAGAAVDFASLPAADYLVHIAIPNDATGQPMYKVTGEEDINIGNGDQIVPQVLPPACVGPLHTVDLAGDGDDGYPQLVGPNADLGVPAGVTVPASTPTDNATFLDIGGSPFEGTPRARCDTKLVQLNNGKSIVPIFNIFTDVPVPSRLRTVIIDDLRFSSDPRSIMYGEKAGLAFAPVGIYDFANKLEYTTETDFNGIYDVLMPSTNHISCPTPSGVCANMYRFVANDPGIPGRLNPNYNPAFATHAAGAEALPGLSTFADLAPTQVGLTIERPGTGLTQNVTCPQGADTPQLFTVQRPYAPSTGTTAARTFTINGLGFGPAGQVTLDGTVLTIGGWSDTSITATVPSGTPVGPHQLQITRTDNGKRTVNGLTFHVLGTGYNPNLYEVGPLLAPAPNHFTVIQDALDAARLSSGDDLVVVYPGQPDLVNPRNNPRGAYYENLIMASPVKLQGVGPGGFQGNTYVAGSSIDASAFNGDTALATDWFNKVGAMTWDGNQTVSDGEAIYLLASQNATNAADRARQFTSGFNASIDGFDIRGGNQNGFPGNINDLTGGATGLPPTIQTQGGAIYANAYVRYLQITNNVVQNNAGAYGTIRIGTPDLLEPDTNQHNENVRILNNRIIANGGTNLAGGIGLFAGSDSYEVARNDICGNFSLEYGGGLSVYGRSPNGKIHHNRITLNMSNDEGGGIMMAGQLPTTPTDLSPGTGPVDIYANQIQANLSNDDGGGIRFLMAGGDGGLDQMNVYNNMIVNNVSTHEGGGIAIDDAPNVRVFNNTIMKNLTTATAVTSNGDPAPAGLSTGANSDQLQATLLPGSPTYSKPVLFNNIFWDNRAGTRAGTTVTGIGLADPTDINEWDLGVYGSEAASPLDPTNSIVQQNDAQHPYTTSLTNSSVDPAVLATYDVSVSFVTWRQNPAFVDATLVTLDAPADQMGNYHLANCPGSPACNLGAASKGGVNAPVDDIDGAVRPALGGFDSGADEFGNAAPPSIPNLYFSTSGNTNPPGVGGTADDADIYLWNGTAFSRNWDASVNGLPGGANVDGFARVDPTHAYLSFDGDVTISRPGPDLSVADEDVVYYDAGTWSLYFDGSAYGLGGTDLDAISLDGNTLYFSTSDNDVPNGAGGTGDDADIYRWNGNLTFTRMFDASVLGWSTTNVDGLVWVNPTHVYLSYSSDTTVPGIGTVQDEDVVFNDAGTWSVRFDGTALGLTSGNQDLDAISFASGALPPPVTPALFLSTSGSTNPPGVGGTADDADVYLWNGTVFSREWDASGSGVPGAANVDGLSRVDATHFYVSFDGTTTISIPGPSPDLTVADEDVVFYNAGVWSLYFDGSVNGVGGTDLDAISIDAGTLYFSTDDTTVPPGAGGTGDDADIYRWNGASSYTRMVDASALGWSTNNLDGLVWVNSTHMYLSYGTDTTVPVIGAVQDEDVVYNDAGTWSVYFDGTAHGLTAGAQDVDAFDVP